MGCLQGRYCVDHEAKRGEARRTEQLSVRGERLELRARLCVLSERVLFISLRLRTMKQGSIDKGCNDSEKIDYSEADGPTPNEREN